MSESTTQNEQKQQKDIMQYVGEADKFFEDIYLKKAPFTIPDNWKELIVKIVPYLNVIGIILALMALSVLLGVGALLTVGGAMTGGANPLSSMSGIFTMVFTVAGLVISIMAAQGLFKRKAAAWRLVFYGTLLGVLQNILFLNVFGLVVTFVVGLYVWYQVKAKYTN